MSPVVCRLLGVASVALVCGLAIMSVSAMCDINMLPAALLWACATAAWCFALYRCGAAPGPEDLQ